MKKGFTLIEIMITIALAAIIFPAVTRVFSLSIQSASQGEKYTKAYILAQQYMEGVLSMKKNNISWDWTTTPINTNSGEYYQPTFVSGEWSLGPITTSPSETEGFTSTVQISEVRRDVNGNISSDPWALTDSDSRWAIVSVSWKEKGYPEKINIKSLITKY